MYNNKSNLSFADKQTIEIIRMMIQIVLLVVVTTFLIMFQKSNAIIFVGMFLMLVFIYYYLRVNLFFLVLVGFGGSFTEAVVICLTNFLWKYRSPSFCNIPCWLPLLWAIVGSGVLGLYKLSLLISGEFSKI